jgi:phosphoglycolate phosphatase-like HAD superfamily hydrolase
VRLVLWDIDGTLVSTAGHGRYAFADAFERLARRAPAMENLHMGGRTDPDIALELLTTNSVEPSEENLEQLLAYLEAALADRAAAIRAEGHAMPGVHAALTTLAARDDVVQGLLTGNIRPNAELKLNALGLGGLIDFDIGGYGSDDSLRSALVAVARERALRKLHVDIDAEQTVLIGDTPRDVEAAHAVGAHAIGVATGPNSVAELHECGADAVLADMSDVADLEEALDLPPP